MDYFKVGEWFSQNKKIAEIDLTSNWLAFSGTALKEFIGDLSSPPDWNYADLYGLPQLRKLIAQKHNCTIEQVIITHGAQEGLFLLSLIFGNYNSDIIIPTPAYQMVALFKDRYSEVKSIPLSFKNNFQPEYSKIETLITKQTKLITLTSPHNPSGAIINKKNMQDLIALAESKNIYLLVDEVYRDICFINKDKIPASIHTLYKRGISLYSFSKAYGVPGLRIGYIIGPLEIIKKCRQLREYTSGGSSLISEYIALQILCNRDKIISYILEDVYYNYHIVQRWLQQHHHYFDWMKPEGGLSFFPKLKINISDELFCKELLKKKKVLLLPGSLYEASGHIRIGLVQESYSVFPDGLNRLSKFLYEQYPL